MTDRIVAGVIHRDASDPDERAESRQLVAGSVDVDDVNGTPTTSPAHHQDVTGRDAPVVVVPTGLVRGDGSKLALPADLHRTLTWDRGLERLSMRG